MTMFVIGIACLVLVATLMLRPAWRTPLTNASAWPAHLRILAEQLAEVDREMAAGHLDAQEKEQHRAARSELRRRVLDESAHNDTSIDTARSPRTQLLVTFAVPLFAVALYAAIGNTAGLTATRAPAAAQTAPDPEVSPEAVQAMLASLAQRLEKPSGNPANDLQGWTMLARSYAALQRFADADRAYARAIMLAPTDAQLLADRADVLAVLQGQRTEGEPDRLIAEALRIDPKNPKALALAGSAAYERKDFSAARGYWQRARELAAPGSDFAVGLDRSLAATLDAGNGGAAGTAARIAGRVTIAPALAAKAAPTDTVFIFARAAEGSRMPLAIVRRTVAELPFDFTLDDSLAMSPQTRLSSATRVIVGARISRSGNAMPQAGDLHGESATIEPRTEGLQLVIDTVQP